MNPFTRSRNIIYSFPSPLSCRLLALIAIFKFDLTFMSTTSMPSLQQAAYSIRTSISKQLHLDDKITKNEFTSKIELLQDITFNLSSLLQHNPHETSVWIDLLTVFSDHLVVYKQHYRSLVLSKKQEWTIYPIENRISKVFGVFGRLVSTLLGLQITRISIDVEELLCNTYSLAEVEYIGEVQYFNNTETLVSQSTSVVLAMKSQESPSTYIRILTGYLRCAYIAGLSHYTTDILKATSPLEVIPLIEESSIEYSVINDFFKYSAFNLVTNSVRGNSIEDKYNLHADLFFRVLLNLPNLKLSVFHKYNFNEESAESAVWPEPATPRDPAFVADDPLVRRQEISFMYILNYLLSLTDMSQLVDPDGYYERELQFLSSSLTWRNTKDIRNASRSGSTHSEASLYMEPRDDEAEAPANMTAASHPSLSSMILHGTYSQINIMVCQIFNNLKKPTLNIPFVLKAYNLSKDSELHYNVSLIDPEKFPGKIAYASVLDKIVRLLHVLSAQFLVDRTGLDAIPTGLVDSMSLQQIDTTIKPLMARYESQSAKTSDLKSRKGKTLALAQSIQMLDEISARLDV
ncbi:hypothetical protein PGUG_01336 [Meyerozyma guilliermondii ATCC 6260]|uniref:Uncharacterized protein n=1 Tax=Meyerozyma guilliermondii (strain ATCC 6260 / CBS 566 / DSM 6381 / JCM 1539 / NBRC 10279 / NRRL Y-324) TaxID=294746 RepID=A5DDI5_PICGU|nr:uncharacterized protein PGUG_01336 [Meyerozyma guilliermondii ATCC 6260]EDK37238.2 hypothetical protein PGUG_01336 [Meyerozyma guilliermondii ATCC 6260]